jgi:hypothetical protein
VLRADQNGKRAAETTVNEFPKRTKNNVLAGAQYGGPDLVFGYEPNQQFELYY